jgi:hypothetical protein
VLADTALNVLAWCDADASCCSPIAKSFSSLSSSVLSPLSLSLVLRGVLIALLSRLGLLLAPARRTGLSPASTRVPATCASVPEQGMAEPDGAGSAA